MQKKLLDILCCPKCFGELTCTSEKQDGEQIETGKLTCAECGVDYPIINSIPRFVESDNYASSFGLQWNLFKSEQIDSQNGSKLSEDRFYTETGWDKSWMKGKLVLDAGCGAGRFLDVSSQSGAEVVGIDLSIAVDAAKINMAGRDNVHLVQASIYELPFRPDTFDACYCIGVVQHTPDPKKTIKCLIEKVKEKGKLGLCIYEKRHWYTLLYSKYLVRPVTTRMEQKNLLRLIKVSMPVFFPLTEVLFRVPYLSRVFSFLIPISNYAGYNYGTSKGLDLKQRYRWAIMDTFDMLAPAYDQPQTLEEVKTVLAENGIVNVRRTTEVSLSLTGEKAAGTISEQKPPEQTSAETKQKSYTAAKKWLS